MTTILSQPKAGPWKRDILWPIPAFGLPLWWNLAVVESSWAFIIVGLSDVDRNFGLIQTLKNWASKSVAMAFALLAVEEIELKKLSGCCWSYELRLWIEVLPTFNSDTKAFAVRLHLPRCSRLMTGCSCVLWPLQSPTALRSPPSSICSQPFCERCGWWTFCRYSQVATNSICHNALHHIIYFVFPHWLYFKPHVVVWPRVRFWWREVTWTNRPQFWSRLATHNWASFSTNGKHLRLKIAFLCVQVSLSGFGLLFSELYELHAIVVFAKLEVINFLVVMFLPAAEAKILGNHHIVLLLPLGLYFRTCSPSIALLLLLSSNFLLCWSAYFERLVVVISLFPQRPTSKRNTIGTIVIQ